MSPHWAVLMLPTLLYPIPIPDARAGADHVAALTAVGGVLTWGTSGQGQLGRVGPRLRDPKPTLLRPAPVVFKRGLRGRAVRVTDVACGIYGTFALAEGGLVLAWGLNNYGQLALEGQARALRRARCFGHRMRCACACACAPSSEFVRALWQRMPAAAGAGPAAGPSGGPAQLCAAWAPPLSCMRSCRRAPPA